MCDFKGKANQINPQDVNKQNFCFILTLKKCPFTSNSKRRQDILTEKMIPKPLVDGSGKVFKGQAVSLLLLFLFLNQTHYFSVFYTLSLVRPQEDPRASKGQWMI